jgi:hypothetical protein
MVKYNYFEKLGQLATLAESAVQLTCGNIPHRDPRDVSHLRRASDRLICEMEDALFSDFLPPLERENLAACAHCLSRVMDQASELLSALAPLPLSSKFNEEGQICIKLAAHVKRATEMLPRIRKPDEIPDTQGFRLLLSEGGNAHSALLARLHAGVLPRSAAQVIIFTGRLRVELSRAFDELVEIMLNNI